MVGRDTGLALVYTVRVSDTIRASPDRLLSSQNFNPPKASELEMERIFRIAFYTRFEL